MMEYASAASQVMMFSNLLFIFLILISFAVRKDLLAYRLINIVLNSLNMILIVCYIFTGQFWFAIIWAALFGLRIESTR